MSDRSRASAYGPPTSLVDLGAAAIDDLFDRQQGTASNPEISEMVLRATCYRGDSPWERGLWALDLAVRMALDGGWEEGALREEVDQLVRSYRWPGERCDECTHPIIPGFAVPDIMWAAVVGDPGRKLCLNCFDGFAAQQGVAWEDDVELFPVSTEGWREADDAR